MRGGIIRAEEAFGDRVVTAFLRPPVEESARSTGETAAPVPAPRSAVVDLMETLALRDAEIAGHEEAIAKAFAEGEAAGREAAEDSFKEDSQAALRALKEGIVAAQALLAEALARFETLALAVAIEAVDKLTANPAHYRKMLEDAIAAQVAEVEAVAVLSVTVSRTDFPDTRDVAALAATLGPVGDRIKVSDDQIAGDCTIALSLGNLECGIARQWKMLKTGLVDLADKPSA